MSSSFMNFSGMVNVSNMMFWRIHEFALVLAKEKDIADHVLEKFTQLESEYGSTPDVDIDEYFEKEELEIWSGIFKELADKIFNREIGYQENQEWQIWTIWTLCSFSRLFSNSFIFQNYITNEQYSDEQKYRRLGLLSLKSNDAEQALNNFKIALKINPNSIANNYLIGLAFKKLNQHDKANSFLEKAEIMNGWVEWH